MRKGLFFVGLCLHVAFQLSAFAVQMWPAAFLYPSLEPASQREAVLQFAAVGQLPLALLGIAALREKAPGFRRRLVLIALSYHVGVVLLESKRYLRGDYCPGLGSSNGERAGGEIVVHASVALLLTSGLAL